MGAPARLLLPHSLRITGVARALPSSDAIFLGGELLPDRLLYGCGTSAYQNEDGKVESVWDRFVNGKGKDRIAGDQTSDVATGFRHTYEKDLALFKRALGIGLYDFIISVQTADGKPKDFRDYAQPAYNALGGPCDT
ncbi:glycoside hydrolase family 1 protein [Botryobasidium botryosum FD-172 SS1]|uniref:Glycoside hydrolase family 1 protein n=1 Tax=Botryobasidium botryosum (strain FD-172 SS1) TaxID=930990 RepID=A0A067M8C4_BOTB1|nr:glycoside hydrolase family 1 protein [Botryobasidium botryosum FD-172 SS1]